MRIAYCSDLHTTINQLESSDIMARWESEIIAWNKKNKCNVLILAGDCFEGNEYSLDFFKIVEKLFEHVIFVPGNHEHYFTDFSNPKFKWKYGSKKTHHCYENTLKLTIENVNFYLGTMWFDVQNCMFVNKNRMCDFMYIREFDYCAVQKKNDEFIEFISKMNPQEKNIVVTHHAPHLKRHFNDLDCFYYTDCDDIIKSLKPIAWFHGHMHKQDVYDTYDTKILCNARGHFSPHKCQFKMIEF